MSTSTTKLGLTKPAAGENYSRTVFNNNMDIVDAYVANTVELMSKGLVYQSHVATPSGATADAIINNIASFTFKANRRYRIVWDFSYLSGGPNSLYFCTINKAPTADVASSTANLTILEGRTKGINPNLPNSTFHTGPVTSFHIQGPSDSTDQIKFRILRVAGGDLITIGGTAGERAVYSIYDDGLQAGTIS